VVPREEALTRPPKGEPAAGDPDTPATDLLRLAEAHPAAVLGNPVLPLVVLERPELGAKIKLRAVLARLAAEKRRPTADTPRETWPEEQEL
jgi:hypothetical protein